MKQKPVVLFLCTGNSCRSQMAEALLRHHAGDRFEACSAGLDPKPIHPMTLRVLNEIGVNTEGLRPKSASLFLGKVSVNHAVFVCEKAQDKCPRVYPFALESLYWPFEDPAPFEGTEEEVAAKFRQVRDQIDTRIRLWLAAHASPAVAGESRRS
jgi:arsenate reductase (thioredoxin)